jgi:hypothetical protein
MTMNDAPKRHPFLDDLTPDVTLVSSVLRKALSGRDNVLKVTKAAGTLYRSQTPLFLGTVDGRTFFQYEAALDGGLKAEGLVSIVRDAEGGVTHLQIDFAPLDAVLVLAAGIRDALRDELGAELFL